MGASAKADRAGGLRPEPQASQPKALIPCALEDAIIAAAYAHRGQVDKGGHPYILHPLRVMLRLTDNAKRMAAVLHDTVEDCGVELAEIRANFGDEVADAVDALTRRDGENYPDFIERCGANDIARAVKWADLRDNMDATRLGVLTEADQLRMAKYRKALGRINALANEARRAATVKQGAVNDESAGR